MYQLEVSQWRSWITIMAEGANTIVGYDGIVVALAPLP